MTDRVLDGTSPPLVCRHGRHTRSGRATTSTGGATRGRAPAGGAAGGARGREERPTGAQGGHRRRSTRLDAHESADEVTSSADWHVRAWRRSSNRSGPGGGPGASRHRQAAGVVLVATGLAHRLRSSGGHGSCLL